MRLVFDTSRKVGGAGKTEAARVTFQGPSRAIPSSHVTQVPVSLTIRRGSEHYNSTPKTNTGTRGPCRDVEAHTIHFLHATAKGGSPGPLNSNPPKSTHPSTLTEPNRAVSSSPPHHHSGQGSRPTTGHTGSSTNANRRRQTSNHWPLSPTPYLPIFTAVYLSITGHWGY